MRPKKKIKQEDIARELGVSIVSVSNALSGKKGVSDELRDKILKKASQMGYHPSPASRRNIGRTLRAAVFSSSYRSRITDLLEENCSDYGIKIEVVRYAGDTMPSFERPDLIFFAEHFDEDIVYQILGSYDVPAVAIGYFDSHIPIDYVLRDNMHNAALAVLYLYRMGHTSAAFVGRNGRGGISELDCRIGFCSGMVSVHGASVFDESLCFDSTQEAVRAVTDPASLIKPTAMICADNDTALLLIRDLGELGYKVPGDVSVISCDSEPLGELTRYSCDDLHIVQESLRVANDRLRNHVHCEGAAMVEGKLFSGRTVERKA